MSSRVAKRKLEIRLHAGEEEDVAPRREVVVEEEDDEKEKEMEEKEKKERDPIMLIGRPGGEYHLVVRLVKIDMSSEASAAAAIDPLIERLREIKQQASQPEEHKKKRLKIVQ